MKIRSVTPNNRRNEFAVVARSGATYREQQPIHVVWGIPKGHSSPAVLITAYRPDPEIWEDDYLRRRK